MAALALVHVLFGCYLAHETPSKSVAAAPDAGSVAFPPGWLRFCREDRHCDDGFACVDNACTVRCEVEPSAGCLSIHPAADCMNVGGQNIGDELVMCDYQCDSTTACGPLGADYECWWQRCRARNLRF